MTKLGPHSILVTEPGLRWARHAPVVKSLDRLAPLQAAQDGAILIFRHYWADQGNTLKQGGAWAAAAVISKLQGFRHPRLYLEGMNETCQRLGHGLEKYVVWQQQFSDYCHARGYKVAGFSFSTGNPEPEDWRYVQKRGFGGCDILSIHEYWGNEGFSVWNACRHRMVHGWLEGEHPPMLITECGRDRVEGGEGGWQLDGVSPEQYLAELRAYDTHIMADLYILGATPFTSGPTGDWWAFDMDGISDEILGGDLPMLHQAEDLAHQIWDDACRWREKPGPVGYNPNTALGYYAEVHPQVGAMLTDEYDSACEQFRLIRCACKLIIAEKGSWRTDAADSEAQLRIILARWEYPKA